jgi:type IV pilus assembly protein PilE
MKKMRTIFCGFSLLEVLIVLTLIAILTSIALPIYSSYLIDARRLEAASWLTKLALAMEQYYVGHNSYKDATLTTLQFSEWIVKNNYQLIIQSANDHDYILVAKPSATQAEKDTRCGSLTLNALGEKNSSGTGDKHDCW